MLFIQQIVRGTNDIKVGRGLGFSIDQVIAGLVFQGHPLYTVQFATDFNQSSINKSQNLFRRFLFLFQAVGTVFFHQLINDIGPQLCIGNAHADDQNAGSGGFGQHLQGGGVYPCCINRRRPVHPVYIITGNSHILNQHEYTLWCFKFLVKFQHRGTVI